MLLLLSLLFNNGLVSSSVSRFMDHISRKLCCCLNMLLFVTLSGVAPHWVFFSTSLEEINMFKDRLSCVWLLPFLEILKAQQLPCFCFVPRTFPSKMGTEILLCKSIVYYYYYCYYYSVFFSNLCFFWVTLQHSESCFRLFHWSAVGGGNAKE